MLAARFFFGVVLFLQTRYVVDAETGGKNGNFNRFAEFRIGRESPFRFYIVVEFRHEVVYFVHFLHHEGVAFFSAQNEMESSTFFELKMSLRLSSGE